MSEEMHKTVKRVRSALPIYGAALVWIIYGMIGPIYRGWHMVLCAGISAAVYLGLTVIFPGRTVEVEKQVDTGDAEVNQQIAEGRRMLKNLADANAAIPSEAITAQLNRITRAGEEIYSAVEKDPKNASQVRKFMNYYMPTTDKLLTAYRTLMAVSSKGEHVTKAMSSVENSLNMIAGAFEKQLDNLFSATDLDISTDIRVLETMMAGEGLTDSGIQTTIKEDTQNG